MLVGGSCKTSNANRDAHQLVVALKIWHYHMVAKFLCGANLDVIFPHLLHAWRVEKGEIYFQHLDTIMDARLLWVQCSCHLCWPVYTQMGQKFLYSAGIEYFAWYAIALHDNHNNHWLLRILGAFGGRTMFWSGAHSFSFWRIYGLSEIHLEASLCVCLSTLGNLVPWTHPSVC